MRQMTDREQYLNQLRRAGWRRPYGNANHYQHKNGGKFYHDIMLDGVTWWYRMHHSGIFPDTRVIYHHRVMKGAPV